MNAADPHLLTTPEQLEALYPAPRPVVLQKVAARIDPRTAEFIAASPFCLLATFGARGPHCTPRGDAPGFVHVLDATTLALPDRRGNNRLDGLRDVLDNPAVALLFLVPGAGETLRIAGRARLSTEPSLLARHTVQGQAPACVMLVDVAEVFMQCQRAVLRAKLWGGRDKPAGLPSAGELLAAHTGGMVEAAAYDAEAATRVPATLY